MSFVEWVTALALLLVGIAGIYNGILALLHREGSYDFYSVVGIRGLILGLLYGAGGVVALLVVALMVTRAA